MRAVFRAAGTVDDYGSAKKLEIARSFAAALNGVAAETIVVDIASGSVIISVTIPVANASAAATAASTLETSLGSANEATSFLSNADVSVEAVEAIVATTQVMAVVAPSPPPPFEPPAGPPSPAEQGGGGLIVIIVAAAGGAAAVVIAIALCYAYRRASQRKKDMPQGITAGDVTLSTITTQCGIAPVADWARPQKLRSLTPTPDDEPGGSGGGSSIVSQQGCAIPVADWARPQKLRPLSAASAPSVSSGESSSRTEDSILGRISLESTPDSERLSRRRERRKGAAGGTPSGRAKVANSGTSIVSEEDAPYVRNSLRDSLPVMPRATSRATDMPASGRLSAVQFSAPLHSNRRTFLASESTDSQIGSRHAALSTISDEGVPYVDSFQRKTLPPFTGRLSRSTSIDSFQRDQVARPSMRARARSLRRTTSHSDMHSVSLESIEDLAVSYNASFKRPAPPPLPPELKAEIEREADAKRRAQPPPPPATAHPMAGDIRRIQAKGGILSVLRSASGNRRRKARHDQPPPPPAGGHGSPPPPPPPGPPPPGMLQSDASSDDMMIGQIVVMRDSMPDSDRASATRTDAFV